MISYYDGQLTDIMPENITQKPEVKALSYALQQACRLLYRYSRRLYIYTNLDEQPEEVIDLLASELRTQYYRSTFDLDTKRQLVKNTLIWYMSAGTPEAVEELVNTIFGGGKIEEWFEYGDDPYYFKVKTDAVMKPQTIDEFMAMLRYIKNTRSWLRMIETFREIRGNRINIGSGIISCAVVPIGNAYQKTIEQTDFLQHAAALISCVKNYVYTGRQEENGNV